MIWALIISVVFNVAAVGLLLWYQFEKDELYCKLIESDRQKHQNLDCYKNAERECGNLKTKMTQAEKLLKV